MNQKETISARNNFILITVLLNLVILFVVAALLVSKLGFGFGAENDSVITKESADLLIKPLGKVTVASADAIAAAATVTPVVAAPPAETTKTDKALALITEKGYICMGCHQVDKRTVGPAYQEVAAKYKGDEKVAGMLAAKIKVGGAGTWGAAAMPPNPTITDDDLKVLVDWILTLESAAAPVAEIPVIEEIAQPTTESTSVGDMTAAETETTGQ